MWRVGWIDANATKERLYVPPVEEGDVMRARAVVEVVGLGEGVKSSWKVGQVATATTGWTEYAVVKEAEVTPAP